MNALIASIFFIIIAQTPPNLPSPTPWASPTPQISSTDEVDLVDSITMLGDYLATTEAELEALPPVEAPSGITEIANVFAFMKWLSQNDRALLGPFAPLYSFLIQFTAISLFLLSVWLVIVIVTTIYKIGSDLWRKISGFIPG